MRKRKLGFTCLIFKEERIYVSFCPQLKVASCGDTKKQARQGLNEAVRLFLEESQKMGTLRDILQEEGFRPKDARGCSWAAPPLISTEESEVAF